jgi:P27 family predicted phage terminase small subunit
MSRNVISADNMQPGDKSSGRHWTKAEISARETAADDQQRDTRTYLRAPDWLGDEARKVWDGVKGKLRGIELLDNLDTELLAVYCDAVVQYRLASARLGYTDEAGVLTRTDEDVKAAQSWARIVAMYADKLGLTPGGRARLAKKKADKVVDVFAEQFG